MSSSIIFKSILWIIASSLLLASFNVSARAEVKVLASIKPLALIAQEVVGENGVVDTLLPIAASPHDYPLRVSDMRRLREASLVLWVGHELESFLRRPLDSLARQKQVSAYHLPGIFWPDELLKEKFDGEMHHLNDEDHHHHDQDPHIWLDPRNAIVIARALAIKLAEVQPSSAEVYLANAESFAREITALDQRLVERLRPVTKKGFAVYHEGYLHFVGRYQLHQVGFVTYAPERRPGARHLYELRKVLKDQALCLFTEPYYDQRNARELAKELGLRIGVLDPIGGEHINSYQALLETMATDFLACLTQT